MTGNLTGADYLPLSDEAYAAAQRQAAIRLAALALKAARGDKKKAARMLRPALQAIGALPYDAAHGKYRWGQAT